MKGKNNQKPTIPRPHVPVVVYRLSQRKDLAVPAARNSKALYRRYAATTIGDNSRHSRHYIATMH